MAISSKPTSGPEQLPVSPLSVQNPNSRNSWVGGVRSVDWPFISKYGKRPDRLILVGPRVADLQRKHLLSSVLCGRC
jgi:hypothetical protein